MRRILGTFEHGFVHMCVCFICVLTVQASIRDPACIGGWRLFENWHLLEHGNQNPWLLLEAMFILSVMVNFY